MAQNVLPEDLSRKLNDLARRENRAWEEVLQELVDARIAKADELEAIRLSIARKLYPMAREYWQEIGDEKRLALTDDELDAQFWLIDHEGIPRLKEDQGKIEIPHDPLEDMIGWIEDADS